jgi:hypothetical protein
MRAPSITSGQAVKVDAGWVFGMNTLRHPWLLREDQYRRGTNVVNRGGVVQTRPGFAMRLVLPPGNLQGMVYFRRNKDDSNETTAPEVDYLVFAVDGSIYASPFPLQQPRDWNAFKIPGIQMDSRVNQVHMVVAEKTVELLADDALRIVPTYNVLMIQDGINQAAFWDGFEARALDETSPALETPKGTWMAFSGGRLWVVRGRLVLASDLYDPLKFTERTEGEGRGDFSFPRDVTGIAAFIGDQRQEIAVVFTKERSEILQSGIRDRSKWASTTNFQSVLFPSVGCVAGRSITYQSGLMWWYGLGGLVSSDTAATTYLTSQVNFRDAEMAFSKQYLADDQSGICGVSFENYLLMSMPIRQNLNSETFVLDYSSVSELSSGGDRVPAWSSVWTGIRPIQWSTAFVGNKNRVFAASVDYVSLSSGSHNHVWEAFTPEREDSFFTLDDDFTTVEYRQPIFCEMETRLLGDGLDMKRLRYAEIDLREISGFPQFQAMYRGTRGEYKRILCRSLKAPTDYDNLGSSAAIARRDELGDLRRQSRRIRTQEADPSVGCPTCENVHSENIDKAFSLLLRWCGQLAVESLRVFIDPEPETSIGECLDDEQEICVVDETGQNHLFKQDADFIPTENLFENSRDVTRWSSVKSATFTSECPGGIPGPITATAEAEYVSSVSQEDADQNALDAAQDAAERSALAARALDPC